MNSEAVSHVGTFQEFRPLLFGIAYRMLGSADEADDILQDAYLRFQAEPLDEVRTHVQPAAIAGASFHAAISNG